MKGEEVENDQVSVASPGIGAAINCRISMVNVATSWNKIDNAGLHRSTSPGAGAFTPYHDRQGIALQDIAAGQELYATYGESYFKSRTSEYGQVPLQKDFEEADALIEKVFTLVPENCTTTMTSDLVNLMVNIPFRSRTMSAIPITNNTCSTLDAIRKVGTGRQYQTTHTLEWLQKNGRCMDHIRAGPSTIPHAGRGAFATQFIPKGHVVAPAPLIHIVDKTRLLMSYGDKDSGPTRKGTGGSTQTLHEQLLVNYCFSHANSSLLLSPYGMITGLINHSSKNPNVKIEWSDLMPTGNADWRNYSLDKLARQTHSGLAFDYIALQDIQEGDEILLDYGHEWEMAWNDHVRNWKAPSLDEKMYVAAFDLEHNDVDSIIPTAFEEQYSANVQVFLHGEYRRMPLGQNKNKRSRKLHHPRVLDRYKDAKNDTVYMVQTFRLMDGRWSNMTLIQYDEEILFAVPRDAFHFKDAVYSRDHYLPSSFRHAMMVPSDTFPDIWKNV